MPQVKPKVQLVEYTPEPDKVVALAAKLCYSDADIDELKKGVDEADVKKFIERLMSYSHMSPIEHVSFTFSVEGVSRAFLAQVTRHRIASFSVKSQRYVGAKQDFNFIVPPEIERLGTQAVEKYAVQMETIGGWYKEWQDALGNSGEHTNEDARFVLPNACETKMIMTMNARELLHFFSLRCCNRAQWEIRAVATEMLKECKRVAPALFSAAGPACVSGGCKEGKKTCGKAAEMREFFANL